MSAISLPVPTVLKLPVRPVEATAKRLDEIVEAIGKELPDASISAGIMKVHVDVVRGLQECEQNQDVRNDPELRSQVLGRVSSALKDMGQHYLKTKELGKELTGEPDIIRQATLDVVLKLFSESMEEAKIDAVTKETIFTTMHKKFGSFETEVRKTTEEMKKTLKVRT